MPLLSSNWQSPYSCCEATSKAVAAQQLAVVRLLLSSNFKCRCCPAIGSHHIVAVKQLQHAVVAQQLAVARLLLLSNFNMPLLPSNWQSPGCCYLASASLSLVSTGLFLWTVAKVPEFEQEHEWHHQ